MKPKRFRESVSLLPNNVGYKIGLTDRKGTTSELFVSEEGMYLIHKFGYNWFRSNIFKPETYQGKLLSEGSESKVFLASLAERECIVKLVNYEGLERLNKFGAIWHSHFRAPDYSKKFGVTKRINGILAKINEISPFETFELDESPIEYVASEDFMIEEYKKGTNLEDLREQVQKTRELATSNKNKDSLEKLISQFVKEIGKIRKLFFVVGYKRGKPFYQEDFSLPNWLVTGFDSKKLKLSLIDQAPEEACSGGTEYAINQLEREASYEWAVKEFEGNPVYDYLMNLSI